MVGKRDEDSVDIAALQELCVVATHLNMRSFALSEFGSRYRLRSDGAELHIFRSRERAANILCMLTEADDPETRQWGNWICQWAAPKKIVFAKRFREIFCQVIFFLIAVKISQIAFDKERIFASYHLSPCLDGSRKILFSVILIDGNMSGDFLVTDVRD